jgi:hypothetical protein
MVAVGMRGHLMSTRRETILNTAIDLASNFLYCQRKEDSELPVGAIEEAIRSGEITVDEIVNVFRQSIEGEL